MGRISLTMAEALMLSIGIRLVSTSGSSLALPFQATSPRIHRTQMVGDSLLLHTHNQAATPTSSSIPRL